MKKTVPYIIVAILFLSIGYFATKYIYKQKEIVQEQQATLVLEKIKKVFKVIAVEGQISEIFDHKEYSHYDIFPFRKKMLVRAVGKISVGYNIDSVMIDVHAPTKTVTIGPFPAPEILSLDHDIDYYDVSEGFLNDFSPADFTKIQQKVKRLIREKADNDALYGKAEEQKNQLIQTLSDIISIYGWKVEIVPVKNENNLENKG